MDRDIIKNSIVVAVLVFMSIGQLAFAEEQMPSPAPNAIPTAAPVNETSSSPADTTPSTTEQAQNAVPPSDSTNASPDTIPSTVMAQNDVLPPGVMPSNNAPPSNMPNELPDSAINSAMQAAPMNGPPSGSAPPMQSTDSQATPPASGPPQGSPPPPPNFAQYQQWLDSIKQQTPPTTRRTTTKVIHRTRHVIRDESASDEPLVTSPPMSYRQSQDAMLKMAPESTSPPNPDAEAAFNMLTQQNVPLSPQQVIRLRQIIDASQRAAAIPATVPPKPVSTTIIMNLAPGSTPPAIRLAQGYVTSLVFVDSTGAPWPIAAYDVGDPKTTRLQWDNKGNVLLIQAIAPYGDSDLVVRLVGLMTPITLELVSGQRVVDYRTDIHVSGIGPNSKDLPTGVTLPNSANQILLSVLDGVAPPGGKLLSVAGGDCQAWSLGDKMYLRTRLTVLSPGWIGRMVSPDGMIAYEIQRTSSVLVSQYGEPIELKIEGL